MAERITAQEVKEQLEGNGHMTKADLAEALECSEDTIGKRVKRLRGDGELIIYTNDGLRLMTK